MRKHSMKFLDSLPSRTTFYDLEPIKLGTPDIENLASYAMELANAHSVNTFDIAPAKPEALGIGRIPSKIAKCLTNIGRKFRSSLINSFSQFGERSSLWVGYLAWGTGRTDLAALTLLPLKGVLSAKKLQHKYRHWCPYCYDRRRSQNRRPYDLLRWTIASITVCLHHSCFLTNVCPSCKQLQRTFSPLMKPGYCSRCGEWLGLSEKRSGSELQPGEYVTWTARETDKLIEAFQAGPSGSASKRRITFMRNWAAMIDAAWGYDGSAFLKLCGLKESVYSANQPPVLEVLLKTSYCLGISPTEFFKESFQCSLVVDRIAARKAFLGVPRKFLSKEQLRAALKKALKDTPPRSLGDIAKQLGYRGCNRLRAVDARLCKKITARFWTHNRRTRSVARPKSSMGRLLDKLKESLASARPLPPGKVARQLGMSAHYPRHRYPDICNEIDFKIVAYDNQRLLDTEAIIKAAMAESPIPRLREIANRAGYKCVTSLRNSFPRLYDELLRLRKMQAQSEKESIRVKVMECLSEWPPLKWREIEQRVGRKAATISQMVPDLYRKLQSQIRDYSSKVTQQRKQALFDEVLAIVEKDLEDGHVTMYGDRLRSLVKSQRTPNWTTLWDALKAARIATR